MKKILIISNISKLSPSLRYRLLLPLGFLSKKKMCHYDQLSFFSVKTSKLLYGYNSLLKIFSALVDFFHYVFKLITLANDYDIIIVKNYCFPAGGSWVEKVIFSHLKRKCKRFVFDLDDALYLNMTSDNNRFLGFLRNARNKIAFWCKNSNLLLLSNSYIYNDIKAMLSPFDNFNISLNITYCQRYFYFSKSECISAYKLSDNINIVWLGSPHTEQNLLQWKDLLEKLIDVNSKVRIHLIGTSYECNILPRHPHIHYYEWTLDTEKEILRSAHFGLNPIIESPFTLRKSAFKVVQYYRAGIIPLVSPVGVNSELVKKHGGYIVQKFDDVLNAISSYDMAKSEKIFNSTEKLSIESYAENLDQLFKCL